MHEISDISGVIHIVKVLVLSIISGKQVADTLQIDADGKHA